MSLINREDLIAAYEKNHKGPYGGAFLLMEQAEEVKAIPVDWIVRYIEEQRKEGSVWAAAGVQMMLDVFEEEMGK